jgi:hypothetical protein
MIVYGKTYEMLYHLSRLIVKLELHDDWIEVYCVLIDRIYTSDDQTYLLPLQGLQSVL